MTTDPVDVTIGMRVPTAPRVSVVIPAFSPSWLEGALASVRAQTFAGLEIILIDDGSPVPIAPAQTDDLVLVRQSNVGPGGARNRGVALAHGEYVAMLDSDDRWRPEKVARQVAILESRPEVVLSSTNWCYFDEREHVPMSVRFDRATRPGETIALGRLFFENCICCSAAMVRRDALRKTPGMVTTRRFGEDYGLWLRLAMLGAIGYLDDVLVERRVHQASLAHQATRDGSWFQEELSIYEEFLDEHPELAREPFVHRAFGRLYFQRSYHHRSRREWAAARAMLRRSLRCDPRRAKAWIDLVRATAHV